MTAVVTVVFTSCPTRGGQQQNQFSLLFAFSKDFFKPHYLTDLYSYDINMLSKRIDGIVRYVPVKVGLSAMSCGTGRIPRTEKVLNMALLSHVSLQPTFGQSY